VYTPLSHIIVIFLNLGIKGTRMLSFTPRPFYLRGETSLETQWITFWMGPIDGLRTSTKRKISKISCLCCNTISLLYGLVAIATELSRLGSKMLQTTDSLEAPSSSLVHTEQYYKRNQAPVTTHRALQTSGWKEEAGRGPGPEYIAYISVFLGSTIFCRLYKLNLLYHVKFILHWQSAFSI